MKKKLLVFHPAIAPYRIDLFNSLNEYFDSSICLFSHNLGPFNQFKENSISSQLHFKPIYRDDIVIGKNSLFKRVLFTLKMLAKSDFDLVMGWECGITTVIIVLYKLLFRKKFKIINIIDDSFDMLNGNQFSKKHALAEKILIPFMQEIISVEPKSTDYFKNRFKKGFYFPIIQDENRLLRRLNDSQKKSFELSDRYQLKNKKVLLFVGRLVALKNIDKVISIVNELKYDNIKFVIVGNGPCEAEWKNCAGSNSEIIFLGRKEGDELYAWYNLADWFILPSYREAFGAVTNEALIAGCKCLVSKKAGSASLINEGINGYTFDPLDVMDMKKKIRMAFEEPVSKERHNNMLFSFKSKMNALLTRMNEL